MAKSKKEIGKNLTESKNAEVENKDYLNSSVVEDVLNKVKTDEDINSIIDEANRIKQITDKDVQEAESQKDLENMLADTVDKLDAVSEKIDKKINKIKCNMTYIWNGQNYD